MELETKYIKMKKVVFISLITSVITVNSCISQQKKTYSDIDLETLNQKVIGKDVQFVDIRTANEYKNGHIDDAVNIDFYKSEEFKIKLEKYNKEEPIYIYCKSGGRSKKASKLLVKLGFNTIYNYSAGWNEWSSNN